MIFKSIKLFTPPVKILYNKPKRQAVFVFRIEDDMPQISRELQERKVAECAALGIEYIPADELERRELAEQERVAEENRIKELREKCAKRGLDFEAENQKVLAKRAAQRAKAEKKRKK